MHKRSFLTYAILTLLFVGCAGWERNCSNCGNDAYGADWIIVQYKLDGQPMNCWKAPRTSVANEHASDGIYWQSQTGNLLHISGHYSRVQVLGGDYAGAAQELGIDINRCKAGRYLPEASSAAGAGGPPENWRKVP